MIEREFSIPAAEGDKAPGRLTITAAMGTVDQNIQRWLGQFTQPDGSRTAERAKIKEMKLGDNLAHYVDVSGTYRDQAGPAAPAVMRNDYRLLGAILPTKDYGQYFFKFYGPRRTITQHEKSFQEMVEAIEVR
jgi:hypothetical protein